MKAEIQMADVMKNVTLTCTIRGMRGYRVRFWIGAKLVKLAAWVLRCRVSIEGRAL